MATSDKTRFRKTYSFYRTQPRQSIETITIVSGTIIVSGSDVPLSNVHFVDQGSSVSTGNDGSIDAPWLTLAAGVSALAGNTPDSVTLLITPYDYTGESPISTSESFSGMLSIRALGSPEPGLSAAINNVGTGGNMMFENLSLGTGSVGGRLVGRGSSLYDITAFNIDLANCDVNSVNCQGGSFTSRDCSHNANLQSAGILMVFRDAIFKTAPTVTFTGASGSVDIDEVSYQSAKDVGGLTIVNGSLVVPGPIRDELPATLDFGTIGAASSKTVTATLAGLAASMAVAVSPSTDLPSGIVFQSAYLSADTLHVQLFNVTASPIAVNSIFYDVLVATDRVRSI